MRIHGAFVSDQEVHRVVDHLKGNSKTDYLDEILQGDSAAGDGFTEMGGAVRTANPNALYDKPCALSPNRGARRSPACSGVSRRLQPRRTHDRDHGNAGIVGPLQSNGSREVLAPAAAERLSTVYL